MGPVGADDDGRLLRAVADNHRHWFHLRGGGNGIWSVGRNDDLGVRLVARGYEWGWRPHWTGVDLDDEPLALPRLAAESGFEVEPAAPPFAKTLPYGDDPPLPAEAIQLGVRLREKTIGRVVVLPHEGVAGIYSMGVAPKARGRGIGLALTRAALRVAWEAGCRAAALNATAAGERLYLRAGFRSLGWGQTWWPSGDPFPTERQIAIVEAVGFGDIGALESLGATESEVAPTPALAAVTGGTASIDFLLDRFPPLVARRYPPHRGNLLHVAVEHDRPEIVTVALRRGVDPEAVDDEHEATPAGWADYLDREECAVALRR
ncbi:MAG TPA: GNAT family N-acetyltransferase [Solirubrobacterales bacterium]